MALDQWPMQGRVVMGADVPCWACREVRWTHTHACTHRRGHTRTTEISFWLGWPILLTFGAELSTGADAKKTSQADSTGGSNGNPAHVSRMLCLPTA